MSKEKLNLEQDLELTIVPEYQTAPFVIVGDAENVLPIAEAVQREEKEHPVIRTPKLGKRVVEAVRASEDVLTGRRAVIAAKMHDLRYGSTMYDLLKQKRQEERDLAMAKKLGLIAHDRCAKHERALAQVRGL